MPTTEPDTRGPPDEGRTHLLAALLAERYGSGAGRSEYDIDQLTRERYGTQAPTTERIVR